MYLLFSKPSLEPPRGTHPYHSTYVTVASERRGDPQDSMVQLSGPRPPSDSCSAPACHLWLPCLRPVSWLHRPWQSPPRPDLLPWAAFAEPGDKAQLGGRGWLQDPVASKKGQLYKDPGCLWPKCGPRTCHNFLFWLSAGT